MPVYKDVERNTWFVEFNLKDINGNIIRKKKRGFKTKKEASEWEASEKLKKNNTANLTLDELFSLYEKATKTEIRAISTENKKINYECHISPYLGKMKIDKITPIILLQWLDELHTKKAKRKDSYLKDGTIMAIRRILSAVFNFAVKFYGLQKNPLKYVTRATKTSISSSDFWTFEEYNKFISSAILPEKYQIYFEVLYWTGIRSGELHGLTPKDIDFTNQSISINKSFSSKYGALAPKTEAGNRIIKIPEFLVQKLKVYIETLICDDDTYLFPIANVNLAYTLKKVCAQENIKIIKIHGLRHSHASLLFNMGFSALMVKERLGHENIQTTLGIYTHLYKEQEQNLVAELNMLMQKQENFICKSKQVFYPMICTDQKNDIVTCTFPNFPEISTFAVTTITEAVKTGNNVLLQYFSKTVEAINMQPYPIEKILIPEDSSVLYIPINIQNFDNK